MKNKFFVLREIYENKIIDKDKVCYKYNITYSQFDNILSELYEKDKYISVYEKKYLHIDITKQGMEFLNNYKVDKAIILASGLGSRMGEITKNTSKCLLKIKNEVLVERLIQQFKARGIDDVIVLIGYLKEQFYYLKDKYNITLVENPEYNIKNTIASFHHVIDKIDNSNCYISVGDIYLSENVFHLFEIEPYYVGPYIEDCSGEWVYKYDINNKVYDVLDGEKCDYYLGGYSFHTKQFASELCKIVDREYKKENTGNLYWEDLLVRNFNNLPDFYMHKLPYGVLNEYDSAIDLEKSKDEIEYVETLVKKIFTGTSYIENGNDKILVKKISEGLSNFSYIIELNKKKYVLRIPGIASNLFVNRKIEKEVYKNLDKYDLTDKIIYFDERGIKVSEFIDDVNFIDVENDEDILHAMDLYNKLHNLSIEVDYDISITNVLERYLEIMDKYKIRFIYDKIEDLESIKNKCKRVKEYIDSFNRPKTLCHGDAAYVNVLKKNNDFKLIDFEYTGMADPLTDIALFAVYSDIDIGRIEKIIDMYKKCSEKYNSKYIIDDDKKMLSLVVAYMAIDSIACVICELVRTSITQSNIKDFCENRIKMFNKCYKHLGSL